MNGQLSGAKINQNKADFAAQFVNCVDAAKYRCSEFKAIYDGLTNQQYVDKLFQTTGVNASAADDGAGKRVECESDYRAGDGVAEGGRRNQRDLGREPAVHHYYGQTFYNTELNRAFVQLEYFGYMKRDPDEAGYAFWLES